MKNRILLSNLLVLGLLFFSKPDSFALFYVGLFFVLLGETVRLLASGSIVKSKNLTTTGMYSVVRNPLYLGTFLITLGILLQLSSSSCPIRSGVMWLVGIIAFSLIYYRTIRNEENFLLGKYGEEFVKYLKEVPAIVPNLARLGGALSKEYYSKEIFKKNKEYRGFFGVLAVEAAILVKIIHGF